MTEQVQNKNLGLISFQRFAWLGCVIYFAIVSILLIFKIEIALKLSYWGVILVLTATVGQLLVIASDFKRAGKNRFAVIAYILLVVIVTTAALGAFLL